MRIVYFILLLVISAAFARRHTLVLKNDPRKAVLCSTFGFLKGGYLTVSVERLVGELRDVIFTLDRTSSSDVASLVSKPTECFQRGPFLYFSFDPAKKFLEVHNQDVTLQGLVFEPSESEPSSKTSPKTLSEAIVRIIRLLHLEPEHGTTDVAKHLSELVASTVSPQTAVPSSSFAPSAILSLLHKLASEVLNSLMESVSADASANSSESSLSSGAEIKKLTADVLSSIYRWTTMTGSLRVVPYELVNNEVKVSFTIRFPNTSEEGAYNFFVHHCPSSNRMSGKRPSMNLTLKMVEENPNSFLSAGQEPLPTLYSVMCILYFLTSLVWLIYLKFSRKSKFKIHYLMFTVIFIKSISMAFLAVNFYVIGKYGVHEEGWAVMFYITHIIRGVLLFTTILLIGAGWTFIKHMLTPREQSLFMVVIPLQILANIATAVIEESETGASEYTLWKDIFILVDLVCCCVILFPVMWSIRHLQAAAHTDGKAAVNLRNLRLFPHFYIMVIGYVYSTRVVAFLFAITVPYSLTWIIDLFKESVTFLFFVAVGYKFRPVDDNPYLLVSNDDDDEDTVMERIQMEDVWSQSGFNEGLIRVNRPHIQSKATGVFDGQTNPGFSARNSHTTELKSEDCSAPNS